MANDAMKENAKQPKSSPKSGAETFKTVLHWTFRLRSVMLSLPVAVIAIVLAVSNAGKLPGPLSIGAGQNIITISKSVLIMGPLALTALSILMTLISKRVAYPWIISLFTLLLPLVLMFTMTFGI